MKKAKRIAVLLIFLLIQGNPSFCQHNSSDIMKPTTTPPTTIKVNYHMVTMLLIGFFVCFFCMISNILLLHVCRKSGNFPLQQLLGIGDLIYSFTYLTSGPPRIYWLFQGMYSDPVSPIVCFLYPWPMAFNVGLHWPSVVMLAIAMERLIASAYPIWFKQNWDIRYKKVFTRVIYLALTVCLAPGVILSAVTLFSGRTVRRQGGFRDCEMGLYITGTVYNILNLSSGILCAVFSSAALILGKRQRAKLGLPANDKFLVIQRKIERTVMAIVVTSVFMVAVPSLIRLMESLRLLPETFLVKTAILRRYFIVIMILNSGLNFWLYLIFNSEFRKQAKQHILGKGNSGTVSSVAGTGKAGLRGSNVPQSSAAQSQPGRELVKPAWGESKNE